MNPEILRHFALAPAGDSDLGGESAGTLTHAKQAITSTAHDAASRLKSAAQETAQRAKDQAQQVVSETKDETASRIGGYSSSLHESAKSFEQQDPNIAWAAHQMADKVQGVADYIRNADLARLRSDAENFARRHPLAFFGGMFIGGLVIGNLLKASPPASTEDEGEWTPESAEDDPLANSPDYTEGL